MKVAFVSSGLAGEYGGSAQSESALIASLARRMEVQVFCPGDRLDVAFAARMGVEAPHPFSPNDVMTAVRHPNLLRTLLMGTDVLHVNGHWRWENYFWAQLARQMGMRLVLHPRGMFLVGHRRAWLKRIFNLLLGYPVVRKANAVIALSHFEEKQFAGYPIDAGKVVVIPNGIHKLERTASHHPAMPEAGYFLYYGRLESRKNLEFLLDCYSSFAKRGGKFSLVLLGPSEHGYESVLKLRAGGLGIADRVIFLPGLYDERKWDWVQQAAAVLYPSREEAFGRVPFEAISAGVFPVIPAESGAAEYLSQLLPFCLYESGSHQSLTDIMLQFSNIDVQKREMLARAKHWVTTELRWDRIGEKVIALYGSLKPEKHRKEGLR